MRLILSLILIVLMLHAGLFDSAVERRVEPSLQQQLQEQFRQSVNDANAIVKRGEYDRLARYESEMAQITVELTRTALTAAQRGSLERDLKRHAALVGSIGSAMRQEAPRLKEHREEVLGGLSAFNRRLGSIGLAALLEEWRILSQTKNQFVKKPSRTLAESFAQHWTSVSVMITELYLDEELEAPLLEYLERYRAYFTELRRSYEKVGYEDVAALKGLGYRIKMQLQLVVEQG